MPNRYNYIQSDYILYALRFFFDLRIILTLPESRQLQRDVRRLVLMMDPFFMVLQWM